MKTIIIRTTILSYFTCLFLISPLGTTGQGLLTTQITGFRAESRNGNVNLSWKTSSEENLRQFDIEYSRDGNFYSDLGFIPARNNVNGDIYEFEHHVPYNDSAFYRLKIVDDNGRSLYSEPVLFHINTITPFIVNPSVISTHIMNVFLHDPFYSLEVVSLNGTVMLKQNLSGKTGRVDIPLSPELSRGVYIVQFAGYDKTITQKVIVQ
jgi:hypothetical protein